MQRFAEILLSPGHGVVLQAEFLQMRREGGDPLFDIDVWAELHVVAIARHAAGFEQIGPGQIRQRNVDTRGQACAGRSVARHFLQGAGDGELGLANLDDGTNFAPKLQKQAFIDHGATPVSEIPRGIRRRRLHAAIKGKVATERAQLNEMRPTGPGKYSHGGKANLARLRFP